MTLSQLMLVTLACLFSCLALLALTLYVWPGFWLRCLVRVGRGRALLALLALQPLRSLVCDRLLAVWLWDFERQQIILVGKGLSHLGYTVNKVVESVDAVLPIVHPDDHLRLNRIVRHFVHHHPEFTIECRLHRRLGRKPWVRLHGVSLLRGRKGRLRLAIGGVEDISERKVHVGTIAAMNEQLQQRLSQQQDQLRATEQARQDLVTRLRQVLDTVPVSICWKDVHGNYLGCNTQFARVAGLTSPDDIVGKTDYDFWWSAQVPEILQEDENVISAGQPLLDLEQQLTLPSQKSRRLRCSHVPLRDAHGECVGVLKTYQNVTRGYLLAQASDREQRLLQDVLDSTDAMISLVGRDFRFVRVNRLLESVVGMDRSRFVGKKVSDVFSGKLGERATAIVEHIIQTHQPVKEPYILKDQLGKVRHFLAYNNPLFDEQGNVDKVITVSMEITQLKHAQSALEEARAKAEAALQVKSQFLANMSHEIRTPMNAIIGLSQLALSTELSAKTEDYVQKIHYSAENLLGIVNDILDFSKIEAGKLGLNPKPFDLLQMIENLGSIMALKASRKRLAFRQTIEPNTPRFINGDALRLHQVLTNLIGNAVKFTREGHVHLAVRMSVDMGERQILRFMVEDTGVGLSEQQLGQLFQAFEQADAGVAREYGGTGLGLAISQRLVEMMGGDIRVKSEPGAGSVFEFTINVGRADAEAANQQLQASGDQPVDLRGAPVLLVEDNEINQQVALEMLAPLNLHIDTARNGAEAVAMVEQGNYALVLMDIQMPVMDGYTATEKLRERYSMEALPIVGLTANVLDEDRKRMLSVGMNDHIGKPIDRRALEQSLVRWLARPETEHETCCADGQTESAEPEMVEPGAAGAIDLAQGLARVRGRQDRLYSLLDSFFAQYGKAAEQFDALWTTRDWVQLAEQSHAVKGVAGNLAIPRVYQLCTQLQHQAETSQVAGCRTTIEQLRTALGDAAAEFERLKGLE
ncbi:PAS domain-containing hybrid sensor histidine kinase/response regulator [Simiduia agarivorans]|uniref:Sensory/regulatory protein RpfC n=1 Tax=Simiduia agarivorans (strain DSM 21679 / JCM 13881 / BCRC 17597 / SA1) TaxID=1117647 RepID=K4KJU2_SIMAS|nr:PAS domain-containing protein [Simiduia agarivorans]AFU98278.1 PAS domain-containing protein [Simiduia agarivorans SA1 = DSM 21679]